MENMRMPELKALARERRLRGYSRLRKAELIALLQDNKHQAPRRPHPNRPPLPPPQRRTRAQGSAPSTCSMDVYLGTTKETMNQSQTTRIRSSFN